MTHAHPVPPLWAAAAQPTSIPETPLALAGSSRQPSHALPGQCGPKTGDANAATQPCGAGVRTGRGSAAGAAMRGESPNTDRGLSAFSRTFDGLTYDPAQDRDRLSTQYARVFALMRDGRWRTLGEIQAAVGGSEAGVSARLRDARKARFGGHKVERRRVDGGLWSYRLIVNGGTQ